MFIICRNPDLSENKKYHGALTRWGDRWYHATNLAKPTIFEDKNMAEIIVSKEIELQYPQDKIVVCSIDVLQEGLFKS